MLPRIITVLAVIGVCGRALAADSGFYVGASAGQARPSFDSTPAVAAGFPVTFDSSSSAWKAFVAYEFNRYFAVEANYVNLGTYNVNVNVLGTPLFTDINITGWGAALVGTLPLRNDFSLLGRVGETRVRESRGTCSNICAINTAFSADNTWSPSFGIGIKYDFNPNFSARAEAERYTKIGSNDNTFSAHANLYTVGLTYKF
jgi:predicted porin